MNKASLSKLSKGNLSSIKLPKGITATHVVLAAVCVILAALAIYFAISYFSAASGKTGVNRDIQLKKQQINAIQGLQNVAALQSQLEVAQQDLVNDNPFPVKIDNIEVMNQIIQAQTDASLKCLQFSPSDKADIDINGHAYVDNLFSISSSGINSGGEKITRIIEFLKNIEELPYNAISINGLSLASVADQGTWVVGFTLSILSQQ